MFCSHEFGLQAPVNSSAELQLVSMVKALTRQESSSACHELEAAVCDILVFVCPLMLQAQLQLCCQAAEVCCRDHD